MLRETPVEINENPMKTSSRILLASVTIVSALLRRSRTKRMSAEPDDAKDLRIKLLEEELKARDRITSVSEKEVTRAWTAYSEIAKVARLVAVLAAVIGGVFAFFGLKSWTDIAKQLQQSENTSWTDLTNHLRQSENASWTDYTDRLRQSENAALTNEVIYMQHKIDVDLSNQFNLPNIHKLVQQEAELEIKKEAEPLVLQLVKTNVSPQLLATSNQINSLRSNIVSADDLLHGFFNNYKAARFEYNRSNFFEICSCKKKDCITTIAFLLPEVPMTNSIRLQVGGQLEPPDSYQYYKNLVVFSCRGGTNILKTNALFVTYVSDASKTNAFQKVRVNSKRLYGDKELIQDISMWGDYSDDDDL